jgi:hypothetical protein
MDISIYCRKPSKIELIMDELEANINAIVADLHKRLDGLKVEIAPAAPPEKTQEEKYQERMRLGFSAMLNSNLERQLAMARPGQIIPVTASEYALIQNAAACNYMQALRGQGAAYGRQPSLLDELLG